MHREDERVAVMLNGREVGEVCFRIVEYPAGPGDSTFEVARLTRAFLDDAPHGQGIGTACVQYFVDQTGHELELPKDDGQQEEDGSHLVGDGPNFVASLRRTFKLPTRDNSEWHDRDE